MYDRAGSPKRYQETPALAERNFRELAAELRTDRMALELPVGRIGADHAADLVVIDLNALSVQPSATARKQIVYSMQPEAILRVIVGGETVVERGRLTRVDEAEIVAKIREVDPALPISSEPAPVPGA